MEKSRVYIDFQNADIQGRLRLNCIGTLEELNYKQIILKDGQELILYDEELEVNGIVEYSSLENIWVVVIDWSAIRGNIVCSWALALYGVRAKAQLQAILTIKFSSKFLYV